MANETVIDAAGATIPATPLGGWKRAVVAGAHGTESVVGFCCRGVLLLTGLAMLVILTLIVVARYTYAGSIDSGSELTSLIFPIFVMAGIVEAARQGAHIATQVMLHFLREPWRGRLVVGIHLVTATVYFYIAWFAFQNAIIAHAEESTILRVPGSLGYGALAAGLALVGVCSITAIIRLTVGAEQVKVDLADAGPGVV